ncbi:MULTISPECIES: hypothetical protein [Rothia]|uniref:Uncharacterized protein n=1 Tax=Rothia nasimurium TaxID=85336 RepID=A0A1Y1RLZ2_9MICC|nr:MULTISPECIES: hypothetical protein [Rothia]ORC15480.1 hypothetical protein A7979_07015 [Rothia nasimurium]
MAKTNAQAEAEKRSNVESLGMESGAPARSGAPQYSGTKELGSNIALTIFCIALLFACFYALGTYPEGGWIWWTVAVVLYGITFLVPLWILPSKTNERTRSDGTDLYLK